MKKFLILLVVALAAISVAVTAALAKPAQRTAAADICVLLPDPKSSVRWETRTVRARRRIQDGRRLARVVNAQGDAAEAEDAGRPVHRRRRQGPDHRPDRLRLGAAIEKAAAAKGVKSIDYDRQVEGGSAGALHVVRRHTVGVLQGKAVVDGLKKNGKKGKRRRRAQRRPGGLRTRSCSRAGTTRS